MKRQRKHHGKQTHGLTIILVIILFLLPAFALGADSTMKVYSKLPSAPEGLCLDSKGNLYASMPHIGEVVLLKADGSYDHVAWVPSKADSGKGEVFGIDVDKDDNIIAAYVEYSQYMSLGEDLMNPHHPTCGDVRVKKSGVYKIDAKTREVTAVATRADGWPFCFPDDVALDDNDNIYLTDLTYAGVWKISADGKKVVMWSDDPLINWSETSLPLVPTRSLSINRRKIFMSPPRPSKGASSKSLSKRTAVRVKRNLFHGGTRTSMAWR